MYTIICCDMEAMKREIAVYMAGNSAEQCQVKDTGDKSLYKQQSLTKVRNDVMCDMRGLRMLRSRTHTGECTVTACRT